MDSDIHRWRNLASQPFYTHPQEKISLVGRPNTKIVKGKISRERPATHSSKTTEPLKNILDRFAFSQKQDVTHLSSGYLNPNLANAKIQKVIDQRRPPVKFGKDFVEPKDPFPATPHSNYASVASKLNDDIGKSDAGLFKSGLLEPPEKEEKFQQHGVGSMIDLLAQFDSVKITAPVTDTKLIEKSSEKSLEKIQKPSETKQGLSEAMTLRPVRTFVPSYKLSLTKTDQYKTLQVIDKTLIGRPENAYKKIADSGKRDRLKVFYEWLNDELQSRNCPSEGPDWNRLQIYSNVFDRLIEEFRTFAPLLSDIKNEYDKTVQGFKTDQDDLQFLRTKVQKLLSQNENRMLLKFERRKGKELETQVDGLKHENEKLKSELRRKLAIYASYLPASILHEKKKDDPLLAEVESAIITFVAGEDPLTMKEKKIDSLEDQINKKVEEIEDLKRIQERDFVPRITKEKVEEALKDIEDKLKSYLEKNSALESMLLERQNDIRSLESTLREKEQQYQFLMTEYNELAHTMATSLAPSSTT